MPDSKPQLELINHWQEQIVKAGQQDNGAVAIHGGQTKPALHHLPIWETDGTPPTPTIIQASKLSGIIDYQPSEFTITAYAGTTIAQLDQALSQHRQYLPFDPPRLVSSNNDHATIGGAIASGINGAGRCRYGGLRDFILETRFLDGNGRIRVGGRRVVKNAAGFDIPKLMVGSCGRLGIMLDVTLKVFPKPVEFLTIHVFSENIEAAAANISNLGMMPWEIDAIEIQPDSSLLIRLSGESSTVAEHGTRLQSSIGESCSGFLLGEEQERVWQDQQDWIWNDFKSIILRVPLNLRAMLDLDEELEEMEIQRRYGSAGNVAWLKWLPHQENPGSRLKKVTKLLVQFGLTGMVIRAPKHLQKHYSNLLVGVKVGQPFLRKLQATFDPQRIFGNFYDS